VLSRYIPSGQNQKPWNKLKIVCTVGIGALKDFSIITLHHHHVAIKELGHLLTRSGLTHPENSSAVLSYFYLLGHILLINLD
jgi:hypothetical protein